MYKICNQCTSLRKKSYQFILKNCSTISSTSLLSPKSELDPAYVPSKVESSIDTKEYFTSPLKSSERFTLILPPPNVTGTLHLGHALTATVQDIIVKWNRMKGKETIWVPGMDHAGIATQVIVEKKLLKEKGQTRHNIGRENFQNEVWKWKEEKASVIGRQLRRLNVSLDWDRELFTMDQLRSQAVTQAFVRLFEEGLIYRADHLVNWSCILQSAISDIEVEHLNVDGPTDVSVPGYDKPVKFGILTEFAYKFHESDEEIVVATTRPETMLGDVAVAVNPKDARYSSFIGRRLWHPFRKETIPVIADEFVDTEFGTGAVKITPCHNHADFEAGKRHNLKTTLQVIDEGGNLSTACGEFAGTPRFRAREVLLDRLATMQLLRDRRDHQMIVPICSRSKDVVELLLRPQWFVKCDRMAEKAVLDVRERRLSIEPKQFEKTWFNWLENIHDWCISRQLWWGHRIPAYKCYAKHLPDEKIWVASQNIDEAYEKAVLKLDTTKENISIRQDEDVLDTWFSSSLMPFSSFGWPNKSDDLSKYYPLSLMETGHDILFFWVARMIMLGTKLTGSLPFNKILLHGIICDAQGRKMSKSLGNVIAPEDVICGSTLEQLEALSKASHESGILSQEELKRAIQGQKKMFPQGIPECGADALRFTLVSHNIKNNFISFDVKECNVNKFFGNKIWQAVKFTKFWYDNVSKEQDIRTPSISDLCAMDKWILSRLSFMVKTVNNSLGTYDFHVATSALKKFLYYELCDIYLESTKRGLRNSGDTLAAGHVWTLAASLDIGIRCLAPFMPSIAQHLHQRLPIFAGEERAVDFPVEPNWRNETLEKEVDYVMEAVTAIRRLKKIFNIVGKHNPEAYLISDKKVFSNFNKVIEDLSGCHNVYIHTPTENLQMKNTVLDKIEKATVYVVVPDALKESIELDLPKLEKKKEKLLKELDKFNKMISGDTYSKNATPEAQEAHSKKIATLEEKLLRINYMQNFTK